MKKKIIASIIFLIEISLLFIQMSYASYLDGGTTSTTSPYAAAQQDSSSTSSGTSSGTSSTSNSGVYSPSSKIDDDYYILTDGKKDGYQFKIQKSKLSTTDKEEGKAVANQILKVDVNNLDARGVIYFNQVIEEFYKGAYKCLDESDKKTCYNDIMAKPDRNSASVSSALISRAEYWLDGKGYGLYNDDTPKLEAVKQRRSEESIDTGGIQPPSSAAAGQNGDTTKSLTDEAEKEKKQSKKTLYQLPIKTSSGGSAQSLNDMISDADNFVDQGSIEYNADSLKSFSTLMYNILLTIGTAVAVIVGIIIGIKYMTGSIEEKATYKQMLVPYLAGCVIVFGAFGIWKIVVIILENV